MAEKSEMRSAILLTAALMMTGCATAPAAFPTEVTRYRVDDVGRGEEERIRVLGQEREDRLRVGISEPRVDLEHHGTRRREHEAQVENAAIGRPGFPKRAVFGK